MTDNDGNISDRSMGPAPPVAIHVFVLLRVATAVRCNVWPLPAFSGRSDSHIFCRCMMAALLATTMRLTLGPSSRLLLRISWHGFFSLPSAFDHFPDSSTKLCRHFTNGSPLRFFLLIFVNLMTFLYNFAHLIILRYVEEN